MTNILRHFCSSKASLASSFRSKKLISTVTKPACSPRKLRCYSPDPFPLPTKPLIEFDNWFDNEWKSICHRNKLSEKLSSKTTLTLLDEKLLRAETKKKKQFPRYMALTVMNELNKNIEI